MVHGDDSAPWSDRLHKAEERENVVGTPAAAVTVHGELDSELVGVLLLRQHDLLCLDVMASRRQAARTQRGRGPLRRANYQSTQGKQYPAQAQGLRATSGPTSDLQGKQQPA